MFRSKCTIYPWMCGKARKELSTNVNLNFLTRLGMYLGKYLATYQVACTTLKYSSMYPVEVARQGWNLG